MSSLLRSRSLRTKTDAPSEPSARYSSLKDAKVEPRNVSPSRLPYKPHARTVSATSTSSSSSTRGATAGSRVPSSGLSGHSMRPVSTSSSTASREIPTRREKTSTSSRYPPSVSATRPPVTTRPKSSSANSSASSRDPIKKSVTGHTRSRSSVTNLGSATALRRPPSPREQHVRRSGTPTTSGRASTPTSEGKSRVLSASGRTGHRSTGSRSGMTTTSGRPATPTAAGRLHRRGSLERAAATAPPKPSSSQGSIARSTTSTSTTAGAQPKPRAAFSTLQQHYSPAKSLAPKPSTSTLLAPRSPSKLPANVAASAEMGRLQAELLQLCLLYREAPAVDAEWRASAKGKLGERFAKLCENSREVGEQERAGVEAQNVLALRRWASGGSGSLDEKVQSLDSIISGVWSLSDPGGRYARVVRRFERWVDRVCEIEDGRRKGLGLLVQGQDNLFVSELDTSWKNEREGLVRRLEEWKKQLSEIDYLPRDEFVKDISPEDKSGLERMLDCSRNLIEDMLAELTLMEEIEQDALARETDWIGKMNRDENAEDEDEEVDVPRAGAIWRIM